MKLFASALPCLMMCLMVCLMPFSAAAQDVRYITDSLTVPVRSGQGTEYRIVHRGLPSGTQVSVLDVNADTGYTQIRTAGGTEGWILTRYLMDSPDASSQLAALQARYDAMIGDEDSLRAQLVSAQQALKSRDEEATRLEQALAASRKELKDIKRISANALTLDTSNRRLTEEAQVMQTRIEVLEADNQRLKDSEENQAFMNGAFAVLFGVFIALVVPRLRPKRRPSSSWA